MLGTSRVDALNSGESERSRPTLKDSYVTVRVLGIVARALRSTRRCRFGRASEMRGHVEISRTIVDYRDEKLWLSRVVHETETETPPSLVRSV